MSNSLKINAILSFLKRRMFFRFALIGAFNTALGLSLFPILNWTLTRFVHVTLLLNDLLLVISYIICTLSAFTLHKHVTFESQGKAHKEGVKFLIVTLINLGINILLFNGVVHYLEISPIPAQLCIAVGLQLGNYLVLKHYVFWQRMN